MDSTVPTIVGEANPDNLAIWGSFMPPFGRSHFAANIVVGPDLPPDFLS